MGESHARCTGGKRGRGALNKGGKRSGGGHAAFFFWFESQRGKEPSSNQTKETFFSFQIRACLLVRGRNKSRRQFLRGGLAG